MEPIEQVLLEIREAQKHEDSATALQLTATAIGKLTADDRRKLLEMPSMQKLLDDAEQKAAAKGKPGSTVCDADGRVIAIVPWTHKAMTEEFGLVEWTPMQTRWLTFNGVQTWVQQGVPTQTPPQFRDIAMEAFHAEQSQVKTQAEIMTRNFGPNSMIISGDGTEVWRGDK